MVLTNEILWYLISTYILNGLLSIQKIAYYDILIFFFSLRTMGIFSCEKCVKEYKITADIFWMLSVRLCVKVRVRMFDGGIALSSLNVSWSDYDIIIW